jgi:hypothetical protein
VHICAYFSAFLAKKCAYICAYFLHFSVHIIRALIIVIYLNVGYNIAIYLNVGTIVDQNKIGQSVTLDSFTVQKFV